MADNIAITAGAGTDIATDEVGAVNYQEIKIVDGTKEGTNPVATDIGVKANAIRTAPASDITDATYIGDIKFGEAEPNSAAILSDTTAIKTSVELLDNAVDGAYLNTNMNIAGTDISANAGVNTAQTQRVTIATDDEVNNFVGAIDADTSTLAGAVTGGQMQVDIVADASTTAGDVAEDTADSGNPVKVGGKAVLMDGSVPPDLATAEGRRTNMQTDMYGRQLVDTTHPFAWSATDANSAAEGPTELRAAPGANLALYITDIIVSNGAVAGSIIFEHTTAGPTTIIQPLYFGINNGTHMSFKTPIKLPTNVNLGYTSTTMTTHSITVMGYTAYSA